MRTLPASELGLPRFVIAAAERAEVFDLDSHRRAREALDFGLTVSGIGFNIFVIGEDRVNRMTATLAYLDEVLAKRPPLNDWVYLNNFRHPANPTPHRLPAAVGRRLRNRIGDVIQQLRAVLGAAYAAEAYQARLVALRDAAQAAIASAIEELRGTARAHGLDLAEGPDGAVRIVRPEGAPAMPPDEKAEQELGAAFTRVQRVAVEARSQLAAAVEDLNRATVADVASPLLEPLQAEFSGFPGLARWLTEMRVDIFDDPARFRVGPSEPAGAPAPEPPERRYAVNLLVDHGEDSHPAVVVESNPTYENLFGRIEYRQAQGTIETDFTLIRAGSLHRANGGILVVRAEALAADATAWSFLKAALRDRVIRTEEPQRAGTTPIAGAPKPHPVPLDLKVVIVGAPRWYAMFFADPDFHAYFKIKADIDVDMPANAHNLGVYAGLIRNMARARGLEDASEAAIARLLGIAALYAERRDRLSARIELIEDLVSEAAVRCHKERVLGEEAVRAAYEARRWRNARIEDRILRSIVENELMIGTEGAAIGEINALTVYDGGDWRFGTPMRASARASAGRAGIVNIERDVALGGPIQQKGAMVLQGFLAGCFAQVRPLAFTCSITFEQSYGGVEGDSASLAELIAVLSALARVPVRQDLAITGSVNQAGHAQAIGGASDKIEGFYRVCAAKPGGLTGTQGVIVPAANTPHLVLHDEVAAAVAAGRFHVHAVEAAAEAAELMLGLPVGAPDADGNYPPDSLFGRVARRLAEFDRILFARERRNVDDASG